MNQPLRKNKGYITLMSAQVVSSLGDWLSLVAIMTLVGLKWEASPLEVSLVILSLVVPMAIAGPITGTFADRFNRKRLMFVSDMVRAILLIFLALADTLILVYILLFLIGLFSSVFIPAKNGKLKELVPDEQMKSAMSITSMIDSSTKIIGPLLSGVLVTLLGAEIVFYIDSGTFILSAFLILLLPSTQKIEGEQQQSSSFKEDFVVGLRFIKTNHFLATGLLILGISLFIVQLSDSQIIVLIRELTTGSPSLFGFIVTSAGVGTLVIGAVLSRKTRLQSFDAHHNRCLWSRDWLRYDGGIHVARCRLFDCVGNRLWFVAGMSAGLVFIPFYAAAQTDTPVTMTGRVFGVMNSVTTIATIIGPIYGGWLSMAIGVILTFIITSSLLVVTAVVLTVYKSKIERGRVHVAEGNEGTQGAATS
ncbi:MFS transporter [Bacillus coahuilensis]|uniref:MFS transporter n=1 Tax=Bacillus coahuilensis TaxID=408580 RepID=UPI000751333A|nr:MFS transporter [Bacillus coahuilensis]